MSSTVYTVGIFLILIYKIIDQDKMVCTCTVLPGNQEEAMVCTHPPKVSSVWNQHYVTTTWLCNTVYIAKQ